MRRLFPYGITRYTIVTSDTYDDTFWVELGDLPASVTAGTPSSVLVTIEDFSRPVGTPTVTLEATTPVDEGSDVTVTAKLSSALTGGVTIPLTLSNGTAEDGDYATTLRDIVIAGGETEGTGTIATHQDADYDDETFTVALGTLPGSVAAGAVRSVEVTIVDDDTRPRPAVTLSASPNPVREGTPVTVTAELSHALAGAVRIPVRLTPGTAETSDYGTLTSIRIPLNQLSGEGTVATRQDADTDDETFTVALGTLPSSVVAGSPSEVMVTIDDDDGGGTDPPTKVTLKASRNPVPEGATVTLTAELDGPAPAGGVKVGFSAYGGSAFAGVDYTLSPRSECCDNATKDIEIAEGGRTAKATLAVVDDTEAEGAETIEIEAVANTADYTVGYDDITLTIPASDQQSSSDRAPPDVVSTEAALLARVADVSPEAAAGALFGERSLGTERLDALDRLGNANGRYDVGDLLAWIERCKSRGAACGEPPRTPPPASDAALPGAVGAAAKRPSRRVPGRRRPKRRGLRGLAVLLAAALWSCDGGGIVDLPAAADVPEPGTLAVEWTASAGGPASAGALVEIDGPHVGDARAPGGLELYAAEPGDGPRRFVLAGDMRNGPVIEFQVPDRRQAGLYTVRVVEVAGADHRLLDADGYGAAVKAN